MAAGRSLADNRTTHAPEHEEEEFFLASLCRVLTRPCLFTARAKLFLDVELAAENTISRGEGESGR